MPLLVCAGFLIIPVASMAEQEPPLEELVRIRSFDGVLKFEWTGIHPTGVRPISVRGPESTWRVRAPRETRGMVAGSLTLERPAGGTKRAQDFWFISVISTPDQVLISANRGGKVAHGTMLRLIQRGDRTVQLAVAQAASGRSFSISAANLVELRRKHPQQVGEFVIPILQQLAGEDLLLPGAGDVYRVFDEITPDARVAAAVDVLIPDLSAPAFATRERASRELAALGPAATAAVMRLDRAELSAEAAARLDEFLERQTRRTIDNPAAARRDLAFLADCLEFDDPRIRAAARAQIEQITGEKIPLLPAPTTREWANAADVLRGKLAADLKD